MKRAPLQPLVRRRRSGFTLTEVLLVLAILGVIAAMVIPNLLGAGRTAYIRNTGISIKAFENIAKNYAIDHDMEWPVDPNALMNPGVDKNGKSLPPYIEKIPKDAWGMELHYSYQAGEDKPRIWSNGPDKIDGQGNGDDINNWTT